MKQIEITTSAIILNSNDEILLCKSHKWDDKYVIPGGHVEYGEKLGDALVREIKEETTLDVHSFKIVGIKEYFDDTSFYQGRHFLFFDYLCRTDRTDVVLNDEAQSYVWLKYEDINHDELGGDLSNLLKRVFEKSSEDLVDVFFDY